MTTSALNPDDVGNKTRAQKKAISFFFLVLYINKH